MSLSIGIVGLPNVGKSKLFNALTRKSVLVANYPFATIDPSVGVVAVPDPRLSKLSEFSKSGKTIPAAIEFVDIAGLVKGASEGQGLGNKFLANIREVDAIAEVVRIFENNDIIHVDNAIDPVRDIEVVNLELILADLQTVAKRLTSIGKEIKRGDKEAMIEESALKKAHALLQAGKLASGVSFDEKEKEKIKLIQLLSMKPILYVLNSSASSPRVKDEKWNRLMKFFEETGSKWVIVDAGIEHELKDLNTDEKKEFRSELGGKDDGIDDLIKKGYELLDLITYFTTGEDETRAWTIKKGWTAPLAGTAIHNDFKDKFIRAEVIEWTKLLEAGSYASARERGLVRTEGKEYLVQDGDVVEFKI